MDIDELLLPSVVSSPFPMAMGTRRCRIKGKKNDTLASVLELTSTKSLQVQQGHPKANFIKYHTHCFQAGSRSSMHADHAYLTSVSIAGRTKPRISVYCTAHLKGYFSPCTAK